MPPALAACSAQTQSRTSVPVQHSASSRSPPGFDDGDRLERDDFSSNRHPALAFWWSMIFFRKPVPTFRDHALVSARSTYLSEWNPRGVRHTGAAARQIDRFVISITSVAIRLRLVLSL